MEELYRRADRYSTLEDNIRVATQTVMTTSKPTGSSKSERKKPPKPREGQVVGRFVLCKMCTPMCASAHVASSNIMISEYCSHGELGY